MGSCTSSISQDYRHPQLGIKSPQCVAFPTSTQPQWSSMIGQHSQEGWLVRNWNLLAQVAWKIAKGYVVLKTKNVFLALCRKWVNVNVNGVDSMSFEILFWETHDFLKNCAMKAACHKKHHAWQRQHFPMWVLKVSNLLQTLGLWVNFIVLVTVTASVSGIWKCFPRMTKMHSHQELRAANLLVEHCSSFFTIFVSHQWMSHTHPDPSGDWASPFWTFWVENCIDRKGFARTFAKTLRWCTTNA